MIKISALMLSALMLAGCSTTGGNFCDLATPIQPSPADRLTTGTATQLLAHNKTGEGRCGWRP
jgi:hypothetical protein